MSDTTTQQEREAFEAAYQRTSMNQSSGEIAWAIWQAARATLPQRDEPVAEGMAEPLVVATAPKRIWLVIGEDCPEDAHFKELSEVTWCEDKIDANSIEYVRTTPPSPSLRDVREDALELRSEALDIFDGPECPQSVRDAIEWYDASLRVLLARLEGGK